MRKSIMSGRALGASLLLLACAPAQGTVQEILKEYADAEKEWLAEYRVASEEDRVKLRQTRSYPTKYYGRLLQAMQAAPESDAALQAATWILTKRAAAGPKLDPVIHVLHEHHFAKPELQGILRPLSRVPTEASRSLLSSLEAKSPHAKVQAMACFNLAIATKRRADMVRRMKSDAEVKKSYLKLYGKEAVDVLDSQDPADLEDEAAGLYARVQETPAYANVLYGRKTLKEAAVGALYELRNLSIGKVAPEIAGEDLDGVPFKLSDYRGKVVVLDFWGDW